MKIITVLLSMILFLGIAFADTRQNLTTTTYRAGTSTLVKRGDAKIYSINFVATANNGDFMVLNALTDTTVPAGVITDIKAEGKEATSGNTYIRDYGDKPLELSTGLYLVVNNGYVVLTYD